MVVVNQASPDSLLVGGLYTEKRQLAPEQVCHINTDPSLAVTRRTYEKEIRDPIADCLLSRELQDRVLYLVTTAGVPLWIKGDPGPVGDLSSVDSELTLLYRHLVGQRTPVMSRVVNPYFQMDIERRQVEPFNRKDWDLYLVTRLDCSGSSECAQLIERGEVESSSGAFGFDLPSQQQSQIGLWFEETAGRLRRQKQEVVLEDTSAPLTLEQPALGYCALEQQNETASIPVIRWAPGGLGVLLGDTWSALVCRSRESDTEKGSCPPNLVEELVASGSTGAIFNVSDPTTDGFVRPQILFPAYLAGYNLAESAYRATRYLSWHQVVVGDPLARIAKAPAKSDWVDAVDETTGLPRDYSQRRFEFLRRRYATSEEALRFLLRAEAAANRLGLQRQVADAIDKGSDSPGDVTNGAASATASTGNLVPNNPDSSELDSILTLVDDCLTRDPSITEAVEMRAGILLLREQWEEAFKALEEVIRLHGGDEADLHLRLAQLALDHLQDWERAAPHAEWLFSRFGYSDPQVVQLWARVQALSGKPDQAEAAYLRVVKGGTPAPAYALEGLGDVYAAKGDAKLAEQYYRRAEEQGNALTVARIESKVGKLQPPGHQVIEAREDTNTDAGQAPASIQAIDAGAESVEPVKESPAKPAEENISSLNRPARVVARTPIEFPRKAEKEWRSGRIVLRLMIDERGQLVNVEPVMGDDKVLLRAAEQGVHRWRFEPKLVNGRPEVDSINVVIDFELTEK